MSPIPWVSMEAERHVSSHSFSQKYEMPDGNTYTVVHVHGTDRFFDFKNGQNYRPGSFTKKNKAHFMRVRAGVNVAITKEERLDFLTLTTQYDKERPENRLKRIDNLNYAWTKLK
jgi:hypothetical protein